MHAEGKKVFKVKDDKIYCGCLFQDLHTFILDGNESHSKWREFMKNFNKDASATLNIL